MKKIIVTGGAGYVGSHIVVSLIKNGYMPIILDNFSNSNQKIIKKLEIITNNKIIFYNVDIRNKKKLTSVFRKHKIYLVIHCAGFKSVKKSFENPISYFTNNIGSTLSLLECMKENRIFKLIFSSSAQVYCHSALPMKETSKIGNVGNPYGNTKYIIEQILKDQAMIDNKWCIRIARYFNPISNHSSGLIKENPTTFPDNLIPSIINVAKKKLAQLKVYGKNYKTKDGTCIRDYIHVMDLADGHTAMIKNNKLKKGLKVYNFGTGKGYSVLEIIKEFEKNIGIKIPYRYVARRKDDTEASVCDPRKAYLELKWKAKYNLSTSMTDIKKTFKLVKN